MQNVVYKIVGVCGLIGMLWPGSALAEEITLPGPAPKQTPQNAFQPSGATQYAPLQQVLPRMTRESGVQIKTTDPTMLREEVPVNESGPDRNLDLEPVLEGFSRIELFGDDSQLKKVILMNRNEGASSQAPTGVAPPTFTPAKPNIRSSVPSSIPSPRATAQGLSTTKLSQEQLQALIRGAYRSPLPEKLWDDPEYQEFLITQGITSQEDMKDRNKAKNVRKNVRRLLWKLKNKSEE
jgi:hypothetical protein